MLSLQNDAATMYSSEGYHQLSANSILGAVYTHILEFPVVKQNYNVVLSAHFTDRDTKDQIV